MVGADFTGFMASDKLFAFFYHWEHSRHWVRMRISTVEAASAWIVSALEEHHDSIVIAKVFSSVWKKELDPLCAEWDDLVNDKGWAPLNYAMRTRLEKSRCETLAVKKLMGLDNDRVKWRPMVDNRKELMERARICGDLPAFVNNARTYVLWAVNDYNVEEIWPSCNQLITHRANSGFYKKKTIYNEVGELYSEGKIQKDAIKRLGLTNRGLEELEYHEAAFNLMAEKNPRTLRLR